MTPLRQVAEALTAFVRQYDGLADDDSKLPGVARTARAALDLPEARAALTGGAMDDADEYADRYADRVNDPPTGPEAPAYPEPEPPPAPRAGEPTKGSP